MADLCTFCWNPFIQPRLATSENTRGRSLKSSTLRPAGRIEIGELSAEVPQPAFREHNIYYYCLLFLNFSLPGAHNIQATVCALIGVPWCSRMHSTFSTCSSMLLQGKSPQAESAEIDTPPGHTYEGTPTPGLQHSVMIRRGCQNTHT